MSVVKIKNITSLVFVLLLCMGNLNAYAGSLSDTVRVSVAVKQDCNFDDRNVALNSYAFINDGKSTLDGDLSMGCATNSTLKVDITADGRVIFDQTLLDEGFSNQLHIEKDDNGNVNVWQCDSLDDVPLDKTDLGNADKKNGSDLPDTKPVVTLVHVAM